MKVTVIGACGGIGQTLSVLLKMDPKVTELALYDVALHCPGVAVDISHLDSPATCRGFTGDDLGLALAQANVVVIPAGMPRKPGMTRDDLFDVNASIISGVAKKIAESCPKAIVCVITNPVNSTVPIVSEVLKSAGCFDPGRVLGVTQLDVMRSKAFIGERLKVDPASINIDVVGGHSGTTIVPLLSQIPAIPASERAALTKKIQNAGTAVVEAKAGAGSATLSMAAAGAQFVGRVIAGLQGESDVKECAYLATDKIAGTQYFALPVTLGVNGVDVVHDVTQGIPADEVDSVTVALQALQTDIVKGIEYKAKL